MFKFPLFGSSADKSAAEDVAASSLLATAPTFQGPHLDYQHLALPETRTPQKRWPQGEKGLHNTPLDEILRDNGAEVRELIRATPGTRDEKNLVLAIVSNLAAFVHLLPASRNYHHVGPGGLLAHSLNTALYAAGFAQDKFFGQAETPQQAARNANRWVIACIVAGLLHDVGKCRTSILVTENSVTRENCWDPDLEGLTSWLTRTKVQEYLVEWLDNNPQDHHERASLNYLHCLAPQSFFAYLSDEGGAAITKALVLALSGAAGSSLVADVMQRADMRSTSWDRQQLAFVPYAAREVGTTRLAEEALTSIREMVSCGAEKINTEQFGSFYTDHGVFAWRTPLLSAIRKDLDALQVPGVPRDPDRLAIALAERGILMYETPEMSAAGGSFSAPSDRSDNARTTWTIAVPPTGEKYQTCVRLSDKLPLFVPGKEPPRIPAFLLGEVPSQEAVERWTQLAGSFPESLKGDEQLADDYELISGEIRNITEERAETARAMKMAEESGALGKAADVQTVAPASGQPPVDEAVLDYGAPAWEEQEHQPPQPEPTPAQAQPAAREESSAPSYGAPPPAPATEEAAPAPESLPSIQEKFDFSAPQYGAGQPTPKAEKPTVGNSAPVRSAPATTAKAPQPQETVAPPAATPAPSPAPVPAPALVPEPQVEQSAAPQPEAKAQPAVTVREPEPEPEMKPEAKPAPVTVTVKEPAEATVVTTLIPGVATSGKTMADVRALAREIEREITAFTGPLLSPPAKWCKGRPNVPFETVRRELSLRHLDLSTFRAVMHAPDVNLVLRGKGATRFLERK